MKDILFKFLSKKVVQRTIYFILACLWVYMWMSDDLSENKSKELDWTLLSPALLLLIQVLLNNRFMWTLIFSMVAIYAALIVALSIKMLIQGKMEIFYLIPMVLFITWLIYRIKPATVSPSKVITAS